MAQAEGPLIISSFLGINRSSPDHLIQDGQLRHCINANSYNIGAKTKRNGYIPYLDNPDNAPIDGEFFWEQVSGTKIVFRCSGGHIYTNTVGSGQTTWTPTAGTYTAGNIMSFAPLQGNLFFSNGVDIMFYTADGITYQDIQGSGNVEGVEIDAAGSGYNQGDVVTISGGSGTATLSITGVSSGGVVEFTIITTGSGYSVGSGVSTTGGTGSGFTVDITEVGNQTPPKCRFLTTFQGRLWGAGATQDVGFADEKNGSGPSTVYSSRVDDGTDWDFTDSLSDPSAPQYQYIDVDLNGPILGFNKILDYLLIFKDRAFYKFDGATLVDVNYVPCTSNAGITFYKDYAFFPNKDGIWGYAGTTPDIYSIPLLDIYNNLTPAQLSAVQAATYKRKMYFTLGTVTSDDGVTIDNAVAVLDFDTSQWFTYSYATNFVSLCVAVDSDDNDILIGGDSNGNTYQLETSFADNGEPIQMFLQTKWYDDGLPQQDREYTKIYVDALQANETMVYAQTNGANWNFLGSLYTVISKAYFDANYVGAYSQRVRFRFVDSSTTHQPQVRRLILYRDMAGGSKSSGRSR